MSKGTSVIAGVVIALVGIFTAAIIILALTEHLDQNSMALIVTLGTMIGGTVVALTGLLKVDQLNTKTEAMHTDLSNGLIGRKVLEAVDKRAPGDEIMAISLTPSQFRTINTIKGED